MSDHEIPRHLRISEPSAWVTRFAALVKPGGTVLDLACGGGRHGRHFLARGYNVCFVDKNIAPLSDLAQKATLIEADLEDGSPWPLFDRQFDGIVVTNYLFRPLMPKIIKALSPGGVLIYETFARGNEAFARPRNPDHLLKSGELLELAAKTLQVVAYEHGEKAAHPLPGVVQRICAINDLGTSVREDDEPSPHPLHPNS